MIPAPPIWKRALFSLLTFALFLGALEGALTLYPIFAMLAHGALDQMHDDDDVVVICAGDSVTYGLNLEIQQSYPWRLAEGLKTQGYDETAVLMAARPGAKSSQLRIEVRPLLDRLSTNQRPVLYVMLGHNDFFLWDPEMNQGAFDDLVAPASARPPSLWRLQHLLRWVRRTAQGRPSRLDMDPGHAQHLVEQLRLTDAAVKQLHGDLIVLTYVVPGEPPPGLPTLSAQLIRESHLGQPVINAFLREVADDLDLEVLDLERLIDTGDQWNTTWWLDNIHLSPTGLDAVARQVQQHLVRRGLVADAR